MNTFNIPSLQIPEVHNYVKMKCFASYVSTSYSNRFSLFCIVFFYYIFNVLILVRFFFLMQIKNLFC
jgi:hypothetical protein